MGDNVFVKYLTWIGIILFLGWNKGRAQVVPVQIAIQPDSTYKLLRGGQDYFVKGASGFNHYDQLAARGANSVRLYATDANTLSNLNEAQANGLTVMMCLWVPHGNGLNYDDSLAVENKFNNFKSWVDTYKDHPAVLAWAIGNEAVRGNSHPGMYAFINRISSMIHLLDGNHPTLTVTASITSSLASKLDTLCPDLDFLGVNSYGGIFAAPNAIANSSWTKPWMITEWGTNGPWESPRTQWGQAIEASSTKKRQQFKERYEQVILAHPGKCLGSYAFLWGQKNEGSPTWFTLLVNGDQTEPIDALEYGWTGSWPSNRSPEIVSATINGQPKENSITISRPDSNILEVIASDLEGDSLSYEFIIRPWQGTEGMQNLPGASFSGIPGIVTPLGDGKARLDFSSVQNFRNLIVFCLVRDVNDRIAYINLPFRVEFQPGSTNEPGILAPVQDAYIRDGFYENRSMGKEDPLRLVVKESELEGYKRRAFLRFQANPAAINFETASLRLFAQGPGEIAVSVYGVEDSSWREGEINWQNSPLVSPGRIATQSSLQGESWMEWDVTAYVRERIDQGNFMLGFALQSDSSYIGDPLVFQSREGVFQAPQLVFRQSTSISELDTDPSFRCFPNPNNGTLFIELQTEVRTPLQVQVSLRDFQGKLVLQQFLPQNRHSLDLSQLPKGLYFLSLRSEKEILGGQKILLR